ncbi:MAG: extracellular solute-binding protein [Spirochaetota bacterium]
MKKADNKNRVKQYATTQIDALKKVSANCSKAMEDIREIITEMKKDNRPQLPTETELVTRLGYGRYTIREAVKRLVREGILEKIQGKGTFISNIKNIIDFSGWIGTEPPGDIILASMISVFSKKKSPLNVNYHPIPYYQNIEQIVRMAIENTIPNVMQLSPHFLAILHDFDLLLPLDQYLNHNNMKRRYPVDIESGKVGRTIYSVTWALSPYILYYNKNVMKRTGLNPEKPPLTLIELLEMSKEINSAGLPNTWGMSLPLAVNDPVFIWLYPYFLSFNGGFSDSMKNVIIDCNENLAALQFLKDLYFAGCVPGIKDVTEGRMLFASDHIAFWVDGPYLRGMFRKISGFREEFDSHYCVVPIPKGITGRSESILFSHQLAISKHSRDVESANAWIDFLTTDEGIAKYYFEASGCLPSMRDILNKQFFVENPFAAPCIKQMETVSIMPLGHPLFIKSVGFISQVLSKLVTDKNSNIEDFRYLKDIISMVAHNAFLGIYPH